MEFKGLVVMITGGASGMGAATARHLAALGARVAVCDLNLESATAVATEIGGLGIKMDVTQTNSIEAALLQIEATYGGAPRACVNCAGVLFSGRLVGKSGPMELSKFQQVIDVNLTGTFNVLRLVAAKMSVLVETASLERGVIINTASIAAFEGQIGQVAYSASKAGVLGMTLPAARELAQFGIRVMAIAPGFIETPMFQSLPAEAKQSLINGAVFPKRLGMPLEYAKLVAHIIDNTLLNGEVIRLDGAVRLQTK